MRSDPTTQAAHGFALAFAACALPAQESTPADDIVWHRDLTAATELARQTDKPMLVVFR